MSDVREKILQYIKLIGPVLPIQVSKHVNTDIIFASAMLSELASRKLIRISNSKIGSSPLYFLPGQEEKLGERIYASLKGKEKEAFEFIKDKQILREKSLEPWQRIALKDLKDFAIPLQVTTKEGTEIFWKFYLTNPDQAKDNIYKILQEEQSVQDTTQIQEQKEEVKEEQRGKLEEKQLVFEPLIQEPIKKPSKKKSISAEGQFYKQVLDFLGENEIEVIGIETINKAKEFNFIIKIPSNVGNLNYLLKAKDQKSVTEKDIFLAYAEAQQKHLPVIYLTNSKRITAKAKEIVSGQLRGQIVFKNF
ncbi:MAG TPA: hypothetical protein VJB89_01605 [Candidatus Nanoarchaeia archaeon]|nr:hypothetical protein [Candidatus Nanoarchaeia archaeon]